jgi:hypothetical protein
MLIDLKNGWMKGTFVIFHDLGAIPKGKTHWYEVTTIDGEHVVLGVVKWFPRWRKYGFFPNPETVYEEICLGEIREFVILATRQYRDQQKKLRTEQSA